MSPCPSRCNRRLARRRRERGTFHCRACQGAPGPVGKASVAISALGVVVVSVNSMV